MQEIQREEADLSAPQRALLAELAQALPPDVLLHGSEATVAYECDGLSAWRRRPFAVALPWDEAQILTILRACRKHGIPLTPRGAGTGLSGGALPAPGGMLLSTARLNRIVRIDPATRSALVQPGVRNLAVSQAAAAHGLYYAPDPSSQIACSIGGNVAENSGGVHCLKYGLTLHNVSGLRLLTMDGEVLEIGGGAPDTPGLDLLPLIVGSEGMLGVVTQVRLRLLPQAPCAQLIVASFDSVSQAGQAVADLIAEGIIPAGLEMMDRTSVAMVEPFARAGYDLDAAAILLCESDGSALQVAQESADMQAVLLRAGARRLQISHDEQERARLWSGRKNAFPAAGRISPDYYCMDGTIPRRHLAYVLQSIQQMEQEYGLRCANVFHAGDGNLHPLILFDANAPDELARAERFGAAILELCVALGGTITGEHGVGVEKLDSMCVQFSAAENSLFLALKRAFDPANLCNPDKAIPSLARCAEYGRMHIARGDVRFPHLPRF
ncbi:FAD-linked oxidase C-terminal domain-containing protein [Massilia sp. W12]|uniref:FAD-linked oxidase C-terminal domain-containing protein n=1 Tax=Massilia sp. W12 TaxID=3126507 RepID=UPI0030D5A2CB